MPNGQSKMDTPEKLATRRRKTKQKHNTAPTGHHNMQTNKTNLTRTLALLETTGCKDELNIIFMRKS